MGSNPTADTPRKCKHHVERFQLFHSPHLFPMFACRFSKFPLDKHTRTRGTHSFAWKCWLEKRKTVYVWFRWGKKHIRSFTVAGQANTHYMFTLAEKHEWSVAYVPHLRREFREESEGSRDRGNACFNLRGDRASSRSAVQVSAYCY